MLIIYSKCDMWPTWIASIQGWLVSVGWFMLAARLVSAHLDFCTSWGRTQWFLLFKRRDLCRSYTVLQTAVRKFLHWFYQTRAKLWKNAPSRNVEESLKSLDPDPEANEWLLLFGLLSLDTSILDPYDQSIFPSIQPSTYPTIHPSIRQSIRVLC